MNTEWIKHRAVVAAYYRSANAYNVLSRKKNLSSKGLTPLEIQILEHITEHSGENRNMKWFAQCLVVSTSTFTNRVNELTKAGLVAKYFTEDNRKNIILRVTDKGNAAYDEYTAFVQQYFSPVFEELNKLSEEELAIVARALNNWADGHLGGIPVKKPALIPLKPKE